MIRYIPKKDSIKNTVSCPHFTGYNDKKQCGMCMPCLMRIVSVISNGIYNDRGVSRHGINPFLINFSDLRLEKNILGRTKKGEIYPKTKSYYPDAIVNLLDVLRLAFEIKNLPYERIISKYPEFLDQEMYNMYKKFSNEVIATANYYISENPSLKNIVESLQK